MVDSTTTMVPLPIHLTQKLLSTMGSTNKNGKNDDEKTFNRYVRQLVDQYLDKEVVISKQPEDKVEMIVQSCRDKFPEFAHWTTTRIRIYIESCRRLKKIKNSPILLAKRKAAGRKFREGQKLKKIITTQFSMQASESQRHLAEYLLNSNQAEQEPVSMLKKETSTVDHQSSLMDVDLDNIPTSTAFQSVFNTLSTSQPLLNTLSTSPPLLHTPAAPVASLPATFTALQRPMQPLNSISTALGTMIQLSPQLLKIQQQLQESVTPPSLLPSFLPPSSSSFLPSSSSSFLPGLQTSPSAGRGTSPLVPSTSLPSVVLSEGIVTPEPLKPSTTPPPRRSSPLKPTITLPDSSSISPSSSDSGISFSVSGHGHPVTTSPRSLSPKQKNFQIDCLMISGAKSTSPGKYPDIKPEVTAPPSTLSGVLDKPLFPMGDMSMTEILNAKTLVTSYREAANFLYRAASELEQLLPTDHRVF